MKSPPLDPAGRWPPLPLDAWQPTYQTLHRWTQIVGKVRLALAPPQNHWWHVTLYVTPRGLTTGSIPYGMVRAPGGIGGGAGEVGGIGGGAPDVEVGEAGGRSCAEGAAAGAAAGSFEIAFDLLDHELLVAVSDGRREKLPLAPRSVADFYRELMTLLGALGIEVRIWTTPVEIPREVIPFERDRRHTEYDATWATRCFRALQHADIALKSFASRFQGKQSPVPFFWGGFDLACTRFSGRGAPARPGADRITREAYSHEVASFGFWPGSEGVSDAPFYAYGAPEPDGLRSAPISTPARYDGTLREFLLPYDEVRRSPAPLDEVLAFYQAAYDAIAALGRWDRAPLDRLPERAPAGPGARVGHPLPHEDACPTRLRATGGHRDCLRRRPRAA